MTKAIGKLHAIDATGGRDAAAAASSSLQIDPDPASGGTLRFNVEADALCISTVVLAELLHDSERSAKPAENRMDVERFAARLEVLAFDADAAAHSVEIRTRLERRSQVTGAYDLLIAGPARTRGLVAATSNRREFDRVDGLRSEDWLAAGQDA